METEKIIADSKEMTDSYFEVRFTKEEARSLIDVMNAAIEIANSIAATLAEAYSRCSFENELIKTHPNKRNVHLALYHPKARIRKKNRHRILKDFGLM